MNTRSRLILLASIALAACASPPARQAGVQPAAPVSEAGASTRSGPAPAAPGGGGYLAGDGPGLNVPPNLDATPDAVPRVEPLNRFANRPYVALGRTYTPLETPGNYKERGIASWYGVKFNGQHTSSGETYDMYGMTAAHPTLPIPSYARVTNLANHKSVVVRINDRGPFLHDRIIDLSYTAAHKLGLIGNGSGEVEVDSIAPGADSPAIIAANTVNAEPLAPATQAPTAATTPAGGSTYLQLGAFRSRQGAESFLAKMRAELDSSGKQLTLYQKDDLVRVHIGPYASADAARATAEKLQALLGFKPMLSQH